MKKGGVIDGDKLIGTLAVALKKKGKLRGNGVVITEMSNYALDEFLEERGIKVCVVVV